MATTRESTIRYSEAALAAAERLGIDGSELESRKPHTKTGTGSSGTDHQRADGQAALRARETVESAIEKKTGVRQSAGDFMKNERKKAAAADAREEKRGRQAEKAAAAQARDERLYKAWVSNLPGASDDPEVPRMRLNKRDQKKAEKMATELGWPTSFDELSFDEKAELFYN
ncbi:MAG: hypothetical protein MRZ79_09135 [Bacteroidia bacterium]|nr:hypothetical protein [Bacteroidia bacterium]